jgi:chemotaxis methyl-accepting protein methylase
MILELDNSNFKDQYKIKERVKKKINFRHHDAYNSGF